MVLDKSKERLDALGVPQECRAGRIEEVLANPNVDIVVETIGGIGAAKAFVTAALRDGKTVVTSNKELICKFSNKFCTLPLGKKFFHVIMGLNVF